MIYFTMFQNERLQSYFLQFLMQSSLFDQQPLFDLNLNLLQGIDLKMYPPHRLHFLVYALQKGLKPPSLNSMRRTEIRNERKSGATNANKIVNRSSLLTSLLELSKVKKFTLPKKYGTLPVPKDLKPLQSKLSIFLKPKYNRIRRPARVIPKKPISLPTQIQPKPKVKRIHKSVAKPYYTRRCKWIVQKAARVKFSQLIQLYYKLNGIKFIEQDKHRSIVPRYFQKKKANQRRRRRQKHLLIQSNRKALQEIFGDAIFNKGWPVSRKEIKFALGIKQQYHMKPQFFGEFMEMAEKIAEPLPIECNKLQKVSTLPQDLSQLGEMLKMIQADKKTNKDLQVLERKIQTNLRKAVANKLEMKPKENYYNALEDQFPYAFNYIAKKNSKK